MLSSSLKPSAPIEYVRIAEIKVAGGGILKATLGSCVAIAIIDRESGMCGMAHCLLPKSPDGSQPTNARFVDHAFPNLLRAMGIDPAYKRGLTVYLAGGARMVSDGPPIGDLNVAAAKIILGNQRITWKVLATGGVQGCTVVVDCEAQTIVCDQIGPMTTES
jgi:chemotaxis protein CheD